MKIAVEGCAHGELEAIYDTLQLLEEKENVKIDLLICCGDFQSVRNLGDLRCMAIPPKYYDICSFYKYYSGEKVAPYLTIFIGGNHEASNYLQELPYGGWVAPKIYYLGYSGVVNIAGLRIGGISGIFKFPDYCKGRYEFAPYDENAKRSVYHIRNLDVFRLKQISKNIDIFFSHDWPTNVCNYGDVDNLLKRKPFFKADIDSGKLGSKPSEDILKHLKPNYWFSAHLHCKFVALIPHSKKSDATKKVTKFLALDKCLPKRKFLQIVDISHDPDMSIEIRYDLEWLTILYLTNHLLSIKSGKQYMPGPKTTGRWNYTPTPQEKDLILEKFDYELTIPKNFVQNVTPYNQSTEHGKITQPAAELNPQTTIFCEKLGIDDPVQLLLMLKDPERLKQSEINNSSSINAEEICTTPPRATILNLSLPNPKLEGLATPKPNLNMTLPPPKYNIEEEEPSCSKITLDTSDLVTDTSLSFDLNLTSSTPQTKRFKRRNESIYSNNDET